MGVIASILGNVGELLYRQAGTALMLAVLFMFAWMRGRDGGRSGREAAVEAVGAWRARFRESSEFRRVFALAVYTAMMLLRTVLMRDLYAHPLAKFMGGWGLYDEYGGMTAESIENVMLFVPFAFLLMWARGADGRYRGAGGAAVRKSAALHAIKVCAAFSLGIECVQLVLRCGTFQVSDLCYNVIGGAVGAVLYLICDAAAAIIRRKH